MAKFLDKTQIQTPVKRWRDFDNSCQQLTTAFFMRPTIAYAQEYPACKVKCNLKSYARMQPLLKPVLGSVQVHNRAFYIPFRTVWPCWDSFIVASPYTTNSGTLVINSVPTIGNDLIALAFVNPDNGLASKITSLLPSDPESTPFDFASFDYVAASGNTPASFSTTSWGAYRLSPKGRHFMKVLNQLGYRVHFGDLLSVSSLVVCSTEKYSFLPLLCFAKLFLDWMYPAQYAHSGDAAAVDGMFQRQFRYDASEIDLMRICNFTSWAYYGNDYFTSAFDTPTAPSAGYDVGMTIPDITLEYPQLIGSSWTLTNQGVALSSNGTPIGKSVIGANGDLSTRSYPTLFTQYLDDSVKKLTNWQRRHQLVGARVLDRYLSDFGEVPVWEQLKRSQFIGSQSFPIQFQDVMSNADTIQGSDDASAIGAQLGAYAGKGVAYDGHGNFEFSSKEFGMFMIVNTVVPDIAYYQGVNRQIYHKTLTDFLSGEWEDLGTQPVKATELVLGFNEGGANVDAIFGFLPRYSEYKCGKDLITGLFNYNTVNKGLGSLSWSTARSVAASDRHGIGFLRGDDAWQYARIFYGDVKGPESELDKFIFVHRINIKVSMQASPMYDVYEFDEPEGDKIMMQVNGAQL